MKKPFAPYYIVFILLLAACPWLRSQELFMNALGERVQACTDRTMYVSGEKIYFSAVIYNVTGRSAEEFSRILYCELITPDGTRITGRKYLLRNSAGQGCIAIPDETISGVYYLKLYTRFMRNAVTADYRYIMLKIINPFKTDVLKGNAVPYITIQAGSASAANPGELAMTVARGRRTYKPGEEISLTIRGNAAKNLPAGLCLSVVPASTYSDTSSLAENIPNGEENVVYFPETRGIALTGQLIGKESRKPIPGVRVNLSIIGDRDFSVVRTDSSGRFFFPMPDYTGSRDIFLCAEDMPDITPEILIDNDFCSRPVHLPAPPFLLGEEEAKAAYKLAVNSMVAVAYDEDSVAPVTPVVVNDVPFYGVPTEVLVMQKYIDLPTLTDYFTELPIVVKLRKVKGKRQFRFYTTEPEMSLYEPLVLVDWVAVADMEKVLAMSPLEIDRVELVNDMYVKGNITYGGIISFVSKKNDFAGIDLPTSGTFLSYRFLEECPQNLPGAPLVANLPDARNTVYWNPTVMPGDEGVAHIAFTAPGTPGKYCILLREMTREGTVISTREFIDVTRK